MNPLIRFVLLPLVFSAEALAADVPGTQTDVLAKSTSSWNGSKLPRYPQGIPEITVVRLRIAPGSELPLHKHPVINAAVLLQGELEVRTHDKVLRLRSGEALVEVVNQWHSGKNIGTEPADLIIFYAGTPTQPITLKK